MKKALPVPIPSRMAHLKISDRGYPIPFFIPRPNGVPDFRYMDHKKQLLCAEKGLCSICGKKLTHKAYWFITGPLGLKNGIHTDCPMHEDCARFSITVCPHLVFMKAERRTEPGNDPHQIRNKPDCLFLVKADKWEFIHGKYFKFRAISAIKFIYQDNKLKQDENTATQFKQQRQ